ncbi:MAG: hypothetical protein RL065_2121 [Bacteroidota bacterium]
MAYICTTNVSSMKKSKEYKIVENKLSTAEEPAATYLVNASQHGFYFNSFETLTTKVPFNQSDWSDVLHISERTLQRYKKDKKKFEPIYAEKILEIVLLFNRGIEVFDDANNFYQWIQVKNISLGNIKPMEIMDNSFGIQMIKDELGRIEHGILA